jgi:ATP:corrinoid adenosyltransferase
MLASPTVSVLDAMVDSFTMDYIDLEKITSHEGDQHRPKVVVLTGESAFCTSPSPSH